MEREGRAGRRRRPPVNGHPTRGLHGGDFSGAQPLEDVGQRDLHLPVGDRNGGQVHVFRRKVLKPYPEFVVRREEHRSRERHNFSGPPRGRVHAGKNRGAFIHHERKDSLSLVGQGGEKRAIAESARLGDEVLPFAARSAAARAAALAATHMPPAASHAGGNAPSIRFNVPGIRSHASTCARRCIGSFISRSTLEPGAGGARPSASHERTSVITF